MSSTTFLTRESLWPTLKEMAKSCQQRKMVAVPYIGKDGAGPVRLREGDVLICALTEANAKKGLVCPEEIEKLRNKGVNVYIHDYLHAKVYLLGRTAIVCSANLSQSSVNILDEAGLLISDRKVTPFIREWFKDRMGQPVTPEWLDRCKRAYKPPKIESEQAKGRKGNPVGSGTWLVSVMDAQEFPEAEAEAREAGYRKARQYLRRSKKYEIVEIRWTGASGRFPTAAKKGHLLIQVYPGKNGTLTVCPHGKLLGKKVLNRKGRVVTYLYVEMLSQYRTVKWDKFRSECDGFGLRLPQNSITKEITSQAIAGKIQLLVSPENLQM